MLSIRASLRSISTWQLIRQSMNSGSRDALYRQDSTSHWTVLAYSQATTLRKSESRRSRPGLIGTDRMKRWPSHLLLSTTSFPTKHIIKDHRNIPWWPRRRNLRRTAKSPLLSRKRRIVSAKLGLRSVSTLHLGRVPCSRQL